MAGTTGMKKLEVLYTHMKTQKRKKWKEGVCHISIESKRAMLFARHESSGRVDTALCDEVQLDCEGLLDALLSGSEEEFETEKYLVQILGQLSDKREDVNGPPAQPPATKRQRKFKPFQPPVKIAPPLRQNEYAAGKHYSMDRQRQQNGSWSRREENSETLPGTAPRWFMDCPVDDEYEDEEDAYEEEVKNAGRNQYGDESYDQQVECTMPQADGWFRSEASRKDRGDSQWTNQYFEGGGACATGLNCALDRRETADEYGSDNWSYGAGKPAAWQPEQQFRHQNSPQQHAPGYEDEKEWEARRQFNQRSSPSFNKPTAGGKHGSQFRGSLADDGNDGDMGDFRHYHGDHGTIFTSQGESRGALGAAQSGCGRDSLENGVAMGNGQLQRSPPHGDPRFRHGIGGASSKAGVQEYDALSSIGGASSKAGVQEHNAYSLSSTSSREGCGITEQYEYDDDDDELGLMEQYLGDELDNKEKNIAVSVKASDSSNDSTIVQSHCGGIDARTEAICVAAQQRAPCVNAPTPHFRPLFSLTVDCNEEEEEEEEEVDDDSNGGGGSPQLKRFSSASLVVHPSFAP